MQRLVSMEDQRQTMAVLAEKAAMVFEVVSTDVELGVHLCYGDAGAKHFIEPEDTHVLAQFALQIRKAIKRPLAWVHFPVPKDRDDEAYLEPLRPLLRELDAQTDIFVGLVHANDLDGTNRRIATAKRVFGARAFDIATECGLGRRDAADLDSVLEIMAACSK